MVSPGDGKFAFISYSSFAEAEAAIRGLDGKPPLHMRVQFRRKKADISNLISQRNGHGNGIISDMGHPAPDYRYTSGLPPAVSMPQQFHGRPRAELMQVNMSSPQIYSPYFRSQSHYPPPMPPMHQQMQQPPMPPSNGFFPYTPMELQYAERNDLWSRGTMTIDSAGRRHVAMGRGYTRYHIPEPHPNVEEQVSKVSEVRKRGTFQHGNDQLQEKIGRCLACGKYATQTCSICNKHYCNRACQETDWPRHKDKDCRIELPELNNIPGGVDSLFTPLIPLTPSAVESHSREMKKSNSLQSTGSSKDAAAPFVLRKPRHLTGDKATSLEESTAQVTNSGKVQVSTAIDSTTPTLIDQMKQLGVNGEEKSPAPVTSQATTVETISAVMSQEKMVKEPVKVSDKISINVPKESKTFKLDELCDGDFVLKQEDFISKESFVECQICNVVLPGRIYTVQRVNDLEQLINLMNQLKAIALNSKKIEKPELDQMYAVEYANLWHRGLVIDTDPLTVDFVDYGTIELAGNNDEFRELDKFTDIPRYSVLIRFPESSLERHKMLDIEHVVSIKMIKHDHENDIIDVVTKEDEEDLKNYQDDSEVVAVDKSVETVPGISDILTVKVSGDVNITSVIASMTVGETIHAIIIEPIDDTTASGFLVSEAMENEYQTLIDPLKNECDKMVTMYNNYTPNINDFVCFQKPEDPYWLRGIVLKTETPITVASIDEGLEVTPVKVIPVPESFKNVPMFAVELKSSGKLNVTDEPQPITISGCESGPVLMGNFTASNMSVKITKWIPWKNSSLLIPAIQTPITIPKTDIKNNSPVIIQCHRGPLVVFLRSLDHQEIERSNRLIQDVAKAAQNAENLTTPPADYDYVLAQFVDDNYYRAQVLAVDGNQVKIAYIDYGNIEVCGLDKLRKLPVELYKSPMCIVKATLKGIKTTPPTKEASDYLANFAGTEEPMNCLYDVSLLDGVTLTVLSTKEVVNDKVNDLLTPSWEKKEANDEQLYWLPDIDMAEMGEIGETVDVVLIHVLEAAAKYVFAPCDEILLTEIEKMTALTMEYCSKNTELYIPKAGELCIALFEDGNWYRGCCINPSAEPDAATILFLDYGNSAHIKYTDLRKMTGDFLQPPAIGIVCNIDFSINGQISGELLEKLEQLMIPNQQYKITLKSVNDDLEFEIEIPDVRDVLKKIGLA